MGGESAPDHCCIWSEACLRSKDEWATARSTKTELCTVQIQQNASGSGKLASVRKWMGQHSISVGEHWFLRSGCWLPGTALPSSTTARWPSCKLSQEGGTKIRNRIRINVLFDVWNVLWSIRPSMSTHISILILASWSWNPRCHLTTVLAQCVCLQRIQQIYVLGPAVK